MQKYDDHRFGFTLFEVALSVTAVSVLAVIVFFVVNPNMQLSAFRDFSRKAKEKQFTQAISQYMIDHDVYPGDKYIKQGEASLVPVCRGGYTGTSCINFDDLVPDYLSQIPFDKREQNQDHSGYAVFRRGRVPQAIALYTNGNDGGDESESADTTAPTLVAVSPPHESASVDVADTLVITFDEPVVPIEGNVTIRNTVDDSVFAVIDSSSAEVTGGGTDTITITPIENFSYDTSYSVELDTTAFADSAGNAFVGLSMTAWSFMTEVITAGLEHRWKLDDGLGASANDVAGGNHGSLVAMSELPWVTSVPPGLHVSHALEFFGNTGDKEDRVLLSTPVILQVNNANTWSITYWAYQHTNNRVVLGVDGEKENRMYHRNGHMRAYLDDEKRVHIDYNMNANKNDWHHVAFIWDGSAFTGYVDGVSRSIGGNFSGDDTSFKIDAFGRAYDENNRTWDGLLSDIRIYDRALTYARSDEDGRWRGVE